MPKCTAKVTQIEESLADEDVWGSGGTWLTEVSGT